LTGTGKVFVAGMGVTGQAVARRLGERGVGVMTFDDRPGLGDSGLDAVDAADLVVVSPGIPESHAVYRRAAAAGVAVVSEIELAFQWATAPIVAVTGTNGKTTVTTVVAAMLREGGRRAVAAGNIGLPLIDVVAGAAADPADVIVAEVSSFQLQYTQSFRPSVAVWLNFAQDHLDWHATLDDYAKAKARIWRNGYDAAVANGDDPVVMSYAPSDAATFSLRASGGADWHVSDGVLLGPGGVEIIPADQLPRALPHDIANSLAACAAAVAAGAPLDACRSVLRSFEGLPHRVSLVSDAGGVRWYDDSKATTPASVVAALQGFESVVLIAGGRNKGLDLGPLAAEAGRVKAVVAIGDAADEVARAFEGVRPVVTAGSMDEAVALAGDRAEPGDVVLLSPGCASFDWYGNYGERGDDFARAVRQRAGRS
jgi:UDP-N-acetylmuramoylalanine--D-glutamate ligase